MGKRKRRSHRARVHDFERIQYPNALCVASVLPFLPAGALHRTEAKDAPAPPAFPDQ
jgi:hypothetical protein